ncbi:hypothetical protein [Nocardiopsis metallicus]|uniref:Uncharacterized protein n=2 Tax=Nocardiopsis metallicus TaxID=179819 RepID=A0A840W3S7_9ACTN|nr:hypothetical protein [Nocardiopsis metallicus]MBB5490634.1 hypothetical protein [Nocardiopsis metallicus]
MGEPDDRPDHDGDGQEKPDADHPDGSPGAGGAAAEPPDAAPTDLSLQDYASDLRKRVFEVYARNLWPLLLVSGLPVVPLVLLAQISVVLPAREGAYLNGVLQSTAETLGTPSLVVLGTVLVLAVLVGPIPLGGSVLLGGGALLGRRITVRDAWRGALRRYFTTLTWALMLFGLVVVALAVSLWLILLGWPLPLIGVVVLPPLLYLLTPLSVMLPAALLEGHGPLRGLAAAWRVGRERRWPHLLFVAASYGVTVLFNTVLPRSLSRWAELPEDGLLTVALTATSATLVAPLALLLLCAPVVYSGTNSVGLRPTDDLDLSRVDRQLSAIAPGTAAPASDVPQEGSEAPRRGRGRRWITMTALVVALFAPPLVGPVTVAANPFGLAEMTASPSETVAGYGSPVSIGVTDGAALIGRAHHNGLEFTSCDPDCTVELQHDTWDEGKGFSVEGGQPLRTQWMEFEHATGAVKERRAPHPESGLYLYACDQASACGDDTDPVFLRPFGGRMAAPASAVAPMPGGGVVVASYVRHDDRLAPDEVVDGDTGGLRVHVCEDTGCAGPRVLDVPPELIEDGFDLDRAHLDVSGTPEGGFAVAAMDLSFGALSLVTCADADCAEPEVTELVGDRFRLKNESRQGLKAGARVEYRSDGAPVVAYRDALTGQAHLVDCHDAVCSEFTDTAVTGPSWARPVPGLAVDSLDRPHLLTTDMEENRLVLLSCVDRGCEETVSRGLVGFEDEPVVTALAFDPHDRPHMAWVGHSAETAFGGPLTELLYLGCAEPYCGSEPLTP